MGRVALHRGAVDTRHVFPTGLTPATSGQLVATCSHKTRFALCHVDSVAHATTITISRVTLSTTYHCSGCSRTAGDNLRRHWIPLEWTHLGYPSVSRIQNEPTVVLYTTPRPPQRISRIHLIMIYYHLYSRIGFVSAVIYTYCVDRRGQSVPWSWLRTTSSPEPNRAGFLLGRPQTPECGVPRARFHVRCDAPQSAGGRCPNRVCIPLHTTITSYSPFLCLFARNRHRSRRRTLPNRRCPCGPSSTPTFSVV